VVIDFFADFCGPCKLVEPALRDLADTTDVKVVKAKLNENPKLQAWVRSHQMKISFLPTLVLVRNGEPISHIFGAKQIMDPATLSAFAMGEVGEQAAPASPVAKLFAMGKKLFQ
jgi:thioredoxin 1